MSFGFCRLLPAIPPELIFCLFAHKSDPQKYFIEIRRLILTKVMKYNIILIT